MPPAAAMVDEGAPIGAEAARLARQRRVGLLKQLRREQRAKRVRESAAQVSGKGFAAAFAHLDDATLAKEIEEGYIATEDSSEARKRARMLRNRRSAELSRKRKRDRLDELERVVADLQEQNRKLQKTVRDRDLQVQQLTTLLLRQTTGHGKRGSDPLGLLDDVSTRAFGAVNGNACPNGTGGATGPSFGQTLHVGNHNSARVE
mmetsp:Transcript_31873/g.101468  ORF Transcript_31873/g.101468 Transcript_31873/m.101468 type:complete len:204 (-) Transcript_31873:854-1465(-)